MPEKNYMVIDARGDHSFRIPRPDLSLKIGTPNACTQCHRDQTDEWAANTIKKWYPTSQQHKEIHYGEVLAAGRLGSLDANQLLIDLSSNTSQPAIVRATATSQLQDYINPLTLNVLNYRLHDPEALVRFNAISAVEGLPTGVKMKLLRHLLDDDLRMIRIETARVLADSRDQTTDANVKTKLDQAIAEYIKALTVNADRPEALVNLNNLYLSMQKVEQAQAEYEKAIAIDPTFMSAYVNLADLYRARKLDHEGKRYLLDAIDRQPDSGVAYHALGLLYVRLQKMNDALFALQKAVQLEPENIRYKYVYAVALDSTGQLKKALKLLTHTHEQRPADRDVLYALISFHQKDNNIQQAKNYAKILVEMSPWDQNAKVLLNSL
jgi:predicted Zn-dependent protease